MVKPRADPIDGGVLIDHHDRHDAACGSNLWYFYNLIMYSIVFVFLRSPGNRKELFIHSTEYGIDCSDYLIISTPY